MRGIKAIDIVSPTGGIRADLPDHTVDPASLPAYMRPTAVQLASSGNWTAYITQTTSGFTGIGQYNTFSAEDGLLRVRPNVAFLSNNGAERTMGLAWGFGSGSVTASAWRFIAVGLGNIISGFYYAGGFSGLGSQAITITQHTTPDTPVRIIPWLQGGSFNFAWVNQGAQWPNQPSQSLNTADGLTLFNVDGGGFTKSGTFPLTSAADITSLVNRVVVVNGSGGGGTNSTPGRVQWSAVNDITTWPSGGFQDLQDGSIDPIIAVRRTSQTSAIIFRTFSAWIMYGVNGDDASAFGFERLVACDGMPGPAGPSSVVEAEGQYYYIGNDGRIYNFNGSSIVWISGPVDPITRSTINFQFLNRAFGVYNPTNKQILFFYPFRTAGSQQTDAFTDPSVCVVYNLRTGNWDGLWGYSANSNFLFSSGLCMPDWFSDGVITGNGLLGCILGSSTGLNIARLNGPGGQDTGPAGGTFPILARYTSPMYRIDNLHAVLGDSIQLFLKQGYTNEAVTITVEGFQNPYDVDPQTQASFTYDLYDVNGFASKFPPGPTAANNIRGNWVRVSIYTTNIPAQMALGGGTIYVNPDEMGDSTRTS